MGSIVKLLSSAASNRRPRYPSLVHVAMLTKSRLHWTAHTDNGEKSPSQLEIPFPSKILTDILEIKALGERKGSSLSLNSAALVQPLLDISGSPVTLPFRSRY